MCASHMCLVPTEIREDIGSPGAEVTVYGKPNPSPFARAVRDVSLSHLLFKTGSHVAQASLKLYIT